MKYIMPGFMVFALVACASAEPRATKSSSCFNPGERETLLALDAKSFDQTQGQGWRLIADRDCFSEAAQLIAEYRAITNNPTLARHHQAQMHAADEERSEAVALLDELIAEATASEEWANLHYHRATRAFLRNDLETLHAARADLAAIPMPSEFADVAERFKKQYPDFAAPTWPPNLDVVDAFIACFGRSYNEAYGGSACSRAGEISADSN